MNLQRRFTGIAAAALGALMLTASAAALADPPARVARLAYINGPVSFAPAGQDEWVYATLNRPLIPGDRLWVEPGARDELQVGGAALRMGGGSLVSVLNLDDSITQLQLSQGRLNIHVRAIGPGQTVEIDTPNLALAIRQPGDYRVEVEPDGSATMVAVRRGQADAYGDGNAYRIIAPESFRFDGTDLRHVQYARPDLDDEFDRWAAARDARAEHARTVRYVSPEVVGYEDLDEQGDWRSVPEYGNVWVPMNVAPDWAPYRDGHWSWIDPWGWTWVDDAPWGFAVSHYGRWARLRDNWCWVPGPRTVRPVYSPALVVFVELGGGGRHDRNDRYARRDNPLAWFPLAPHEPYRPAYRASPAYVNNINIGNAAIARQQGRDAAGRNAANFNYANRSVHGALTAVPAAAFAQGRHVSRARMTLPANGLEGARYVQGVPMSPQRESRLGGDGRRAHQPPPAMMARPVLARTAPAPLAHAPQLAARGPQARPADAANVRLLGQGRPGGRADRPALLHGPTPTLAVPSVTAPGVPAPLARDDRRRGPPEVRQPTQAAAAPAEAPRAPPLSHGPGRTQHGPPAAIEAPHAQRGPQVAPAPPEPQRLRHSPMPAAPLPAPIAQSPAPASPPRMPHAPMPVPPQAEAPQRMRHSPMPPRPEPVAQPSVQQPRMQHAPAPAMPPPRPAMQPPRLQHAPTPAMPPPQPAMQPPRMQHAPAPAMPPPQPAAPPPQPAAPAPRLHHGPTPSAPQAEAPAPPNRPEHPDRGHRQER
ncbi:MAG: DUF6600 domain-containing protein [Massilia sp.]